MLPLILFLLLCMAFVGFSWARDLGRSAWGWFALILLLGPVALLVLTLQPPLNKPRGRPMVQRAWLALVCVLVLGGLGAAAGLELLLLSHSIDLQEVVTLPAESLEADSIEPALGLFGGLIGVAWNSLVMLFGLFAGAFLGVGLAPFVALGLDRRLEQRLERRAGGGAVR